MASSAAATLTPGGAANVPASSANGASLAGAKSHFKSNASGRSMDGNRRQSGSPIDGPRRTLSQKAWTQGTNPITQRNMSNTQVNGNPVQGRNLSKNGPLPHSDSTTPDKHANDRLLYLLANFIGRPATITVKNGEGYVGIFSGSSFDTTETFWLLKMVRRKIAGSERAVNGVDGAGSGYIGNGPEHAMYFEMKDVVDLAVEGVTFGDLSPKPTNGVSSQSAFRTDADISGRYGGGERTLQRWEPSTDSAINVALEDTDALKSGLPDSNAPWDQFEANERLYGIKTGYDESLYTTVIDRSDPLYKHRSAVAERIAREIEGSKPLNAHVAEERGASFTNDSGMNEEEKYSEVKRGPVDGAVPAPSQTDKYMPPGRRAAGGNAATATPALTVTTTPASGTAAGSSPPNVHDAAVTGSQSVRVDSQPVKSAEAKPRYPPPPQSRALPTRDERVAVPPVELTPKPRAVPGVPTVAGANVAPNAKVTTETNQKQATMPVTTHPPYVKAPGESAAATVENDVRDAFKQFASTEKMRLQERRRNQAKHDKDIKLNDLMKFSQNFKLNTPVPRDLVPILTKDKHKQEEIMERAQRNFEANLASPSTGQKPPLATFVDPKAAKPVASATRYDAGARLAQPGPVSERQNISRAARPGHAGQASIGLPSNRNQQHQAQTQHPPGGNMLPGRPGPGLSQRLSNVQQLNRAPSSQTTIPSPLPTAESRAPPTGPSSSVPDQPRYSGAPTPTSAISTHFNARALEFKPNPAANAFTPTGDPSGASSPRSNNNGSTQSRAPTPSGFFGSKKPLAGAERPRIEDFFNPIKRLQKEAEVNKEDWSMNGGIRPAHKTGPRWDVAEANKDKTFIEMFEKVPFSTQPVSPQHPHYAAPQLPHQHQLPFHLQHGGPSVPQPATPHQAPHHLHPQPHHHPVGIHHHYDDHRVHIPSTPSVVPSPRLQPVNVPYQSPMAQHSQVIYGQPVPHYGIGPGGPQLAPLRQYPAAPHFVPQHNAHMAAPMMAHSSSGGHLTNLPQGLAGPFNQQVPVYSPNPVHAYLHHSGPPPPQPATTGYPSPGRAAPMMIHQGSQPGQPAHPMMMFGVSPGQQGQHLYLAHPPGQGPAPRGAGYLPPQQPHYAAVPHSHHVPGHHRGGPNYGHPPPAAMVHVAAHQGPPAGATHTTGPDGEEEMK